MIEITMPRAGQTMEEGKIVMWLKAVGEEVKKGEVVAEIETDKATFDFESPESGMLLKILREEGDTVPVLEAIALLGEPGEDVEAYVAWMGKRASAEARAKTADGTEPAGAGRKAVGVRTPQAAAEATRPKASPAARRAAAEAGVEISSLGAGSGPGGRILSADVRGAAGAGETIRRPMSKMRKAIAANLEFSKQTIPHFYARVTIDAGPMYEVYAALKARFDPSVNDFVTFAASRAVREFAVFRSRIEGSDIVESQSVNIGIAAAADEGLLVPVVVDADKMSLAEIALETRRVVAAARAGKLEGAGKGVFTVTNLGMFGVEEFGAIVNPGESAILAVGAMREAPVVKGGVLRAGRVMTMTLSADHRIIDGVAAARFLARVKEMLERPESIERPEVLG